MCLITQIVLAARNNNGDDRGWVQLLVFVVMAVLWALGGIAKAKANKIKESDFPAEPPESDEARPKLPQGYPQKPVQKISVKKHIPAPEPIVAEKKQEPAIKSLIEPQIGLEMPREPVAEYPREPVLDFADTDELRKAIIHYEILGKPKSLRATEGLGG